MEQPRLEPLDLLAVEPLVAEQVAKLPIGQDDLEAHVVSTERTQ